MKRRGGGIVTLVLGRLGQALPVAFGACVLSFALVHLIPGDPARAVLGSRATPEAIASLRGEWGLDDPLLQQFWDFFGRLLTGDLGVSLFYKVPVTDLLTSRASVTIVLLISAAALATALAVPLALWAATHPGGKGDQLVRVVPLVGLSMPPFWIGLLLILWFAVKLPWFPVSGYGTGFTEHAHHMVLPAVTIAIGMLPVLVRALRTSLLGILAADYMTTGRAKGISTARLLTRHGLRNAIMPMITVLGVNTAFLVGGTLVVESAFGFPGLGQLMVIGVLNRDFPVIQALTIVFALLVTLVYLSVDVAQAALDPRVRRR